MTTIFSDHFKGMRLFCRAFSTTKHEMWISVQILVIVTLLFAVVMYVAERQVNPDYSYIDALVWTFVKYVEDPAGIVDSPVTVVGQIIGTLVGVLGIAIFAVPAGLIGSGFMDAMAEDKRERQLETFYKILLRDQKLTRSRNFQMFLQTLPQDESAWYHGCQFKYIGNNHRISKYELKGMELKDILDVCKMYPEFRVKNRASALSSEDENKNDVYLLEYFPVNKAYGCFINRGSKVTIVSTSSRSELNTGNFSFYLAKWAGFNYISKDFDADEDDSESYYNNPWLEPKVDGKRLSERIQDGEKVNKEMCGLYEHKKEQRDIFLSDLESLTKDVDSWAICILSQIQNKENDVNIHIAHNIADGNHETIHDMETYQLLLLSMTSSLNDKLGLKTEETTRYPLIYKGKDKLRNIIYKLHEDGCRCNGMTIRVSSHLMEFDTNMRVAEFLMAKSIKEAIEPNRPLPAEDVADMSRTGYGFMPSKEQNIENIKKLIKSNR